MAKKKKTSKAKKTTERKKTHLTASELRKFSKLLLIKRAEILGDVDSMKAETLKKERSDLSNVPFHMADAGSDNYELENTLGLMDEEIKILNEIDRAFLRMEKGYYGICEGSGEAIPKARLEAIPWARYSVQYKELLEKGAVEADENGDLFDYDEDEDEQLDRDDDDEQDDYEQEEEDEEDEEDEDEEEDEELGDDFIELDEHMLMIGDDEGDEENEEHPHDDQLDKS
jgi:DnaK suppressor protein